MLVQTPDGPKKLSTITWQKVAIVGLMFGFAGLCLFLTASHFDASEWKSLGLLSTGFVSREFIPLIRNILYDTTDAYSRGGQVE